MTFDYDIENEDGDVLATVKVEALFSGYVPAFTSGRPEDCYPEEGGELEELAILLDNKDITGWIDSMFPGDPYEAIRKKAYALAKEER